VAANADAGVYMDGNKDAEASRFNLSLANCTFAGNGEDAVYAISSTNSGSGNTITAHNTIFAGSGGDGIEAVDPSVDGPVLVESYNNFHGNAGENLVRTGTGGTTHPALDGSDLTLNPAFVGTPPEPYRLPGGSVLLDAGSAVYAPALDLAGDARPDGAAPSIGAYEKKAAGAVGTLILFK